MVRDGDGNRILNIYLIFLLPKEYRDNEEKSDRLFENLVKNRDLDRLLTSPYDKNKNPFLDLPQGEVLYRAYMNTLDHQDKLGFLMVKIRRWADKKSQEISILKTAKSKTDASVYMQCYLVKYFENYNLSS